MTVSLICEGPCNLTLRQLDVYICKEMRAGGVAPATIDWARRMRYTPHQPYHVADWYACVVCGFSRKFGNTTGTGLTGDEVQEKALTGEREPSRMAPASGKHVLFDLNSDDTL